VGGEEGGGDLGGAVGGGPAVREGLVWLWVWIHRESLEQLYARCDVGLVRGS
jgi:hypothetical protein